jgi:uncharacterized protein
MIDLFLLGVVLLGIFLFLRWFERKNVWHPYAEIIATPADAGLVYEEVEFTASDGVLLHGWYVPCEGAIASLLFCHGNGGNISWRLDSLKQFHSIQVNTFLFDYRGYGKSGGTLSEEGTYLDGEAAFSWLRTKTPDMPIVLFGRSLGAAIATDLSVRVNADALVFESGFSSIYRIGKELFPFLPLKLIGSIHYDSLSKIPNINMPLLVVHSPDDDIIPFRHGQDIFDAAPEPKRFFETRGDHNNGHFDSEEIYLPALRGFLDDFVIKKTGRD